MDAIYKILFSSIREGLLIVDVDNNILKANSRCHELFGYAENELIGKHINELVPFDKRKGHSKIIGKYHKKPESRSMGSGINLKALRKDASTFYVEISLNPFFEGNEKRVAALITDISDRVNHEEKIHRLNSELEEKVEVRTHELRESQRLYINIAQNFPKGTINVFDRDLNYVFVEGKELRANGITGEKLIGTSYINRLSKKIQPQIRKSLESVFQGEIADFEIKHNDIYYNINAVPLKNKNGIIDRILTVEKNITEQKIVEQQQEEALANEKRLNEMKTRFVSMASHEFRTPLSTILSSISLIEKHNEKGNYDKIEKHTKRVKNSVKGLTEILNDFLSVEKLEREKLELNITEFDIRKFVKEVTMDLESICKKGQSIELNIISGSNLNTDKKLLRNILYNLLSNAIKYSKEEQKIIFEANIDSEFLQISIQDFGMGIPKLEQKQLFNRFFRAGNVLNIEGTGLGLHIVKKYLEQLDGEINFKSEEGVGTTFYITIPINH